MAKWSKCPLFGYPQGYAADLSEAFQTVSRETVWKVVWSNA
jgi:hypothetical protein